METIPDTAAQSIKEIERLAIDANRVQTITLKVSDGAGGMVDFPVLVTRGGDTDGLAAEITQAAKFARELRLASAKGPDYREGEALHQSFASFTAHANRFKSDASAIWADPSQRRFVSVLDYHPEGANSKAAWGRHRGVYPAPLSEAWKAWGGGAGLKLSQDDFADLLDARDRELAAGTFPSTETPAPTPAQLVTLAANLEVFSHKSVKRVRDPKTGRLTLTFSEDAGVAGEVAPPRAFLVHIPIFQDSKPTTLEVRLRVTVDEGAATFLVNVHAAREVLAAAFDDLCDDAKTQTGMPVFVGTPES